MTSSFKKWPQFVVLALSILIGKYSGINLLIPAVMIGIFYFLMTKVIFKNDENPYLVSASFLFGHAAWISIGTIVVMATMGEASSFAAVGNLIECLIYFLITLVMLIRPGMATGIITIILEIPTILINALQIAGTEFNTDDHKALVVHIALRVTILIYAALGVKRLKDAKEQSLTSPRPPEVAGSTDSVSNA